MISLLSLFFLKINRVHIFFYLMFFGLINLTVYSSASVNSNNCNQWIQRDTLIGQEVTFQGKVIDIESGDIIPYCSISIEGAFQGLQPIYQIRH